LQRFGTEGNAVMAIAIHGHGAEPDGGGWGLGGAHSLGATGPPAHFTVLAGDDDGVLWKWRVPPSSPAPKKTNPVPPAAAADADPGGRAAGLAFCPTITARASFREGALGGQDSAAGAVDGGEERGAISAVCVLGGLGVVATCHASPAAICLWSLLGLEALASVR